MTHLHRAEVQLLAVGEGEADADVGQGPGEGPVAGAVVLHRPHAVLVAHNALDAGGQSAEQEKS